MFKYVFIIIICAILSSNKTLTGNNFRNKGLVPDTIVCETLNYILNDTIISEFKHCDRLVDQVRWKVLSPNDSLQIIRLDTIFSKDDLDFIFDQNSNSIKFNVGECFKNKVLISGDVLAEFNSRDDFWVKFREKNGLGGFWTISMPLFSRNHCVVILKFSCSSGRLSAYGGTFIFRKIANKWSKIICVESWIS